MELSEAFESGDINAPIEHIQTRGAGPWLNERDKFGETPLLMAVRFNDGVAVDLLLRLGADANVAGTGAYDQRTPLMVSAQIGEGGIASRLLASGADPVKRDRDGRTVIMLSYGNRSLIELFKDKGVDINAATRYGGVALTEAISEASAEVDRTTWGKVITQRLKILIEMGADLHGCVGRGEKPIPKACSCHLPMVVNFLLEAGAEVDAVNSEDMTGLMLAALWGDRDCCELLLAAGADARKKDAKLGRDASDWARAGESDIGPEQGGFTKWLEQAVKAKEEAIELNSCVVKGASSPCLPSGKRPPL